jgi:hypothetical protein
MDIEAVPSQATEAMLSILAIGIPSIVSVSFPVSNSATHGTKCSDLYIFFISFVHVVT